MLVGGVLLCCYVMEMGAMRRGVCGVRRDEQGELIVTTPGQFGRLSRHWSSW